MRGFSGMDDWLFVILTVIIGVLALMWGLSRMDFSGVNDDGQVASGGSIVFGQVEDKVTAGTLDAYLEKYAGEKLKGKGQVFYSLGVKYDIDPAFAVAVARRETSLGKNTCNGISQGCNNFFCMKYNSVKEDGILNGMCQGNDDQWASFADTDMGIEGFYKYIKRMYVDKGRDTIAEIGCAPGSGYSAGCYCAENGHYCSNWIGGSTGIPTYMEGVRDYAA